MISSIEKYKGLNDHQAALNLQKFGDNKLSLSEEKVFVRVLKNVVTEPMFFLLLIACSIYFAVGWNNEGLVMLCSIILIANISFFQEYRSRNSIKALKKIITSKCTVVRNSQRIKIEPNDIVVDDIVILEEGEIIPADCIVLSSNDFFVNESVLTGESFTVFKSINSDNLVFRGTLVTSGSAIVKTIYTGNQTKFGKLGISLQEISIEKTPLQIQIRNFVKYMVSFGALAFIIVVAVNYYHSENIIWAILKGLTLAMSILPEEIPVAFSTFQALGSYRLLKNNNIIVKQPQYVETLGSSTVICADKTGTITENSMTIAAVYDSKKNISYDSIKDSNLPDELIEYAMWSSEINPFDPMEKAIHDLYVLKTKGDVRKFYTQVHEYPLKGNPPFMTHIFKKDDKVVIAAKGAPEAIMESSNLNENEKKIILNQIKLYAIKGYRVLGIAKSKWDSEIWPSSQKEFVFDYLGLLAFYDPPKKNMIEIIKDFKQSGITFKMITGDYPETASAIAKQINLISNGHILSGKEVIEMNNDQLDKQVNQVDIFARMFPEAKLKVIESLKRTGEIVAMTGDGVNDAPALKAAHIGIAMGIKGSEVAKSAAAIIITDDDIGHMIDAVALGRKIYDNLKKAIQYILSIHIPIILLVLLPLMTGSVFNNLFTPIHIIFLELIMGPTCSIIYENEPIEPGTMSRPPRKLSDTFLSFNQMFNSIVQGLMITAGCFLSGYFYLLNGGDEFEIRTAIFITLLFCNILLTLTNRSFYFGVFTTFKNKNPLITYMIIITFILITVIQLVPAVTNLFDLSKLSIYGLLSCFVVSFIFTWWFEIFKFYKRKYNR